MDLDRAELPPSERLFLEFVDTLTKHAYRITDEQLQGLRDVGCTDAQIAGAVYGGAYFNMMVRLADAFDIHPLVAWEPGGISRAVSDGPVDA